MDKRTGEIISGEEYDNLSEDESKHFIEIEPTERQIWNKRVRTNDPCPCNSGKKFKKCCKEYV